MYYALILTATLLFGLQFFFNRLYQKSEGDSGAAAMAFAFLTAVFCAAVMFCLNGFRLSASPFSLVIAALRGVNTVLFAVASVKALGKADLATFSVFAMLGGMLLPFFGGVLFWHEELTAVKIVCCVLIALALWLGAAGGLGGRGALKYYFAVFFLNGMSGVLSKLHQTGKEHISNEGYMLLSSLFAAALAGLILLGIAMRHGWAQVLPRRAARSLPCAAGYALLTGAGNLLLLIALDHVEASVQYPLVTGGTIVISAVISALCGEKPGARRLAAVAVAFAATLVLVF